jgi:antitoxin (DNA-binding transcriptional repressor) of toxin-antitoxin stability system
MSKEVTVAELRERLDEIIAAVEAGEEVKIVREKSHGLTIVQRGRPFPLRGFVSDEPRRKFSKSSTELLREDRDSEFDDRKNYDF